MNSPKSIFRPFRLRAETSKASFHRQTRAYEQGRALVLIFYVLGLMSVTNIVSGWEHMVKATFINPVWIVRILEDLIPGNVVHFAFSFHLIGLVAAILCYQERWARALFFVGGLLSLAVMSSFGKIDHGGHLYLFISFALVFLPRFQKEACRIARQKFLTVIVAIQGIVLTVYSLAGFWKILPLFEELHSGTVSLFTVGAFPAQIAASLIEKQLSSAPGFFLIEQPYIALIVGLLGIFFEFFALSALFKPRVHAFWGFSLIFMHLGAIVFMKIHFTSNIILLGLFLCASPFAPPFNLSKTLKQLPPFFWFSSLYRFVATRSLSPKEILSVP